MRVTDNQLFQIHSYLMSEGVTDVSLQEDLADHFCCVIEESMQGGQGFELAFEKAKDCVAPQGVVEFQQDLDYLLTIKKKVMIRKLVYAFGFIGMLDLFLALGLLFSGVVETKVTGLIAMAGILTLSISVVPFWFYQLYKRSVQRLHEA